MRGFLRIITKDLYLGQKLRWELSEYFERIDISDVLGEKADTIIFDCRLGAPIPKGESVFYLTEDGDIDLPADRCLPLPLPIGFAEKKLQNKESAVPLLLIHEEHSIRLYNQQIRLTELEFSLLSVLFEAKGSYIPRETLRSAVWGEEGTDGLLNIYIHYLRTKLEREGEKVILSSRKSGYALAEKFVKGEREC
jgi:DNA-binding winged helix-turn-helix (wHTH) protein